MKVLEKMSEVGLNDLTELIDSCPWRTVEAKCVATRDLCTCTLYNPCGPLSFAVGMVDNSLNMFIEGLRLKGVNI